MTAGYESISANRDIVVRGGLKVRTYEEAEEFLRRFPDGRIGKNTSNVKLVKRLAYIGLILYQTEIVRYYPNGTFTVDNGGVNTITTSTRVNQFTPDQYRFWHHQKYLTTQLPNGPCTATHGLAFDEKERRSVRFETTDSPVRVYD